MFTTQNSHRLPSELEVMPFILRLMEFIGLWGPPGQIVRFLAAFGWGTMIILFPKAVLGIGSARFDAIAKGIAEFIFEGSLFVATAIFASKRIAFERLIDGLKEIFQRATNGPHSNDCYVLLLRQNLSINKFVKGYTIYCCFGPFVFCVPSLAASHFRYWTHSGNQSEPLIFELPMEQEFYGLQIRTNFLHYHIFVLLSLFAYFVCAYFLLVKVSVHFIMIQYSSSTYRLVALRIRKMTESKEVTQSELVDIVELHRLAYRCSTLVEQICHLPLALEFLTCILFWCLTMFYVSNNIDFNLVNVMVLFWLSLLETFGYSYLGSKLTEQADEVGAAIYDLPWFEHSVELQRYYRLMLQRVQRPTGITGAKFFVVQLATFGSVVQMSYSYYLVLKEALTMI
uniref:Odorant receptor n=1 Tax=Culex quinquefasciatus TaxID=7176 RepID=A0A3Q8HEV1_CULQU|nr:odorant receptor 32 [Culex quinquefasciatus]